MPDGDEIGPFDPGRRTPLCKTCDRRGPCHFCSYRSWVRPPAWTMIRGWRPVNRRFDEQRRTVNERNARLAASYPNPDVNDLLASVNELSQLLFEHPMHTLVQMLLANARAMSDDDSEFPPYWTRPDEGHN